MSPTIQPWRLSLVDAAENDFRFTPNNRRPDGEVGYPTEADLRELGRESRLMNDRRHSRSIDSTIGTT